VDNVTHSLIGVALADAMLGGRATKSRRPLFVGAGVIAANLPDIDLAYTAITPAPLGYLLHHRGHTHTIVGLVVLLVALILAYRLLPPVRGMRGGERLRLWLLMAIALASHLSMDALNSYGVHPFYPVDNRWYYGDAVFIFEPALWVVLGVAVAWNARRGASRLAAAIPILILLVTIASMDVVPLESAVVLGVAGALLTWLVRRMSPRARAGMALTAVLLMVVALVAASREARAGVLSAMRPLMGGRLVDVVLTPNPSSPLCWGVIGIESVETRGEYVLWRGTFSLAPAIKAPTSCVSYQFADVSSTRRLADRRLVLIGEIHQSLARLRDLSRDCWTGAWLRFGRAPVITGEEITDLRFADRRAQGFTRMRVIRPEDNRACPSFVPTWQMPRADLFTSTSLVFQRNARTRRDSDGFADSFSGF
jgi:inner membrane protein